MELKKFIMDFADQFDDTDASEITAETNYKELDEWSSLLTLSVIAMAKTDYGKTVSGTEVRGCNTVGELFNLIEKK
jgi:acyl carrier protein